MIKRKKEMAKLELTNMVMVQNPKNGDVVVQRRIKSWKGVAFPGGHVENNESIYDSAVREIREETGLNIKNLKACGLMYWFNDQTEDRYFVHCYKTTDYSGNLIDATDEGSVFWTSLESLKMMQLAPNFERYLEIFLRGTYTEAYCAWHKNNEGESDEKSWQIKFHPENF